MANKTSRCSDTQPVTVGLRNGRRHSRLLPTHLRKVSIACPRIAGRRCESGLRSTGATPPTVVFLGLTAYPASLLSTYILRYDQRGSRSSYQSSILSKTSANDRHFCLMSFFSFVFALKKLGRLILRDLEREPLVYSVLAALGRLHYRAPATL